MANAMDADARQTRNKAKCERSFLSKDGTAHPRSFAEVDTVKFRFLETNTELLMRLSDLPEGVLRAAAAFGINTSVGNTFGAIADPHDAFEAAQERWEALTAGDWSAERAPGGPRTKDIVEAVVRWYVANGRQVSDADREKLRATLADPAQMKATSAHPEVARHLAALRLERAEERVREMTAKAKESPADKLDLL